MDTIPMTWKLRDKYADAALDRVLSYISDERHIYTGGRGARRTAAHNDVKAIARAALSSDARVDFLVNIGATLGFDARVPTWVIQWEACDGEEYELRGLDYCKLIDDAMESNDRSQ